MHIQPTDDLRRLLPSLYDAAGNDALWRPALQQGAAWLEAAEIRYFVRDRRTGGVRFSETAGRLPAEASEAYFHDWAALDTLSDIAQRAAVGELIPCHHYFDAEFVRRDPFYNGFLIPLGLRWVVGVKLFETPEAVAIGGIHRGPNAAPYDGEGLVRVGAFVEALSHAAALHARFRDLGRRLVEAQTMADTLATALLVVEADGHVLTTNAAADAVLRRGDGLRITKGRIRAADPAMQPVLAAAIAAAAEIATGGGGGGVGGGGAGADANGVLLPRIRGGEPYRTAIWPLAGGGVTGGGDRVPRVLLSIVDPGQAVRPAVPPFAAMHRLTAAEAALVERLAAGEALAEIADRRGVRISTLRTQLSTVLAKTGTRRQGDVIRLLSAWPAFRQVPPR